MVLSSLKAIFLVIFSRVMTAMRSVSNVKTVSWLICSSLGSCAWCCDVNSWFVLAAHVVWPMIRFKACAHSRKLTIGVGLLRSLQWQHVLRGHGVIGWIGSIWQWFVNIIGGRTRSDGDLAEFPSKVGWAQTPVLLNAHTPILTQHRTHDCREKERTLVTKRREINLITIKWQHSSFLQSIKFFYVFENLETETVSSYFFLVGSVNIYQITFSCWNTTAWDLSTKKKKAHNIKLSILHNHFRDVIFTFH